MRDFTLQTAALLEGLGHRVEALDHPIPRSFVDDFVLYWGFGDDDRAHQFPIAGAKIDRDRLDNLTLGLDRHGVRRLHRLPLAIARLNQLRRVTERFYRDYDVLLTPDPHRRDTPDRAPRSHRGLSADHRPALGWVGFTPLQNDGEPAISLPLAQSANGMPVGMMLSAPTGQGAGCWSWPAGSRPPGPFPKIQASVQA